MITSKRTKILFLMMRRLSRLFKETIADSWAALWLNFTAEGSDTYPHNPRGLEWLLSFALIFTGIATTLPDNGGLGVGLAITCIVVGFSRIVALIINGHWKRSPVLRALGAVIGAFIWAKFMVSPDHFTSADIIMYHYPLFVWAELYSCSRSARDVMVATAGSHGRRRDESANHSH